MIPDSRLQSELGSDETLLWQGVPSPTRLAQRSTLLSIFGGCFTLFALIWMAGAGFISFLIAGATGWKIVGLAPLFGLIFLAAGLAMLFSPLAALRRGAHTLYALTDRRALIIEPQKVRSYAARDLNALERRDLADGRGDLVFRHDVRYRSEGDSSVQETGFFGIENPREVERLIRQHLKT